MDKKKPEWINNEQVIIQHMNSDHCNSIVSALNVQHGIKDPEAKMKNLDVKWYYILSCNKTYFIKFEKSWNTTSEYKDELIKQAKKNRNFEHGKNKSQ